MTPYPHPCGRHKLMTPSITSNSYVWEHVVFIVIVVAFIKCQKFNEECDKFLKNVMKKRKVKSVENIKYNGFSQIEKNLSKRLV